MMRRSHILSKVVESLWARAVTRPLTTYREMEHLSDLPRSWMTVNLVELWNVRTRIEGGPLLSI